jgi:hypothetical protein
MRNSMAFSWKFYTPSITRHVNGAASGGIIFKSLANHYGYRSLNGSSGEKRERGKLRGLRGGIG